jgi:hypothetical protein
LPRRAHFVARSRCSFGPELVVWDGMRSVVVLAALVAACSRPAAAPRSLSPSEVKELAALPPGYSLGDSLSESCAALAPRSFDDEALSDVDCTFERLSRTLAARAGERGERFLVGKRCRSSNGTQPRLSCSAAVARPTAEVPLGADATKTGQIGLSAPQVRDWDEPRPQDASRIRVSFRPSSEERLPARAYDRVDETTNESVGRRRLGQVSARCESACEAASLRHALRVVAGRVGAGEVSGVACFQEGEGARCVATALAPWSS